MPSVYPAQKPEAQSESTTQSLLAPVLPLGATHASVPCPANVATAHTVPLVQLALLQHVSSHRLAAHTPERQSPAVAHAAPGAPAPCAGRATDAPEMQ